MITVGNYTQKRTNIDFAKLGTEYKQGDEFVKENIDLYSDDATIAKFIDVYIAKLNKQEGEEKVPPVKKGIQKKWRGIHDPKDFAFENRHPLLVVDKGSQEHENILFAWESEVIKYGDKHPKGNWERIKKASVKKAPAKKKRTAKKAAPKAKKPVERAQGEINLVDEKLEKAAYKKGLIKALVEKEGEAKRKATGKQFAPRDRMRAEKEIRAILKKETEGKTELTTAEVIMIGRKINAERSLYSQFVDLSADHKVRRWPTEKNLKAWAKNPGQSDLIAVDTFKKDDATMGKQKGKSLNFWMM